ncbi:hypothetical protein D3C80_2130750 [compost metagenome]
MAPGEGLADGFDGRVEALTGLLLRNLGLGGDGLDQFLFVHEILLVWDPDWIRV